MQRHRATTCCSAVALILIGGAVILRGAKAPDPLSLFPVLPVWNVPLDKPLAAPPAFAGTLAFVPYDAGILAFDLTRQQSIWTATVPSLSKPAASDDLVFVAAATGIVALRQQSGAVAWRAPLAERLAVPLVWDNGWLIASGDDGTVTAFRATDGEQIWRRELGVPVHAAPALSADRIYIPLDDGRLVTLSVTTGEPLWNRKFSAPVNDILALEERIYLGSNDNFFYCLEVADGTVAWRWRTGADVVGLPAIDDRLVYFVSFDNLVRALDRHSGAQRWKRALPYRPTRGPVRVGDELLVSGLAQKVSAFSVKDGTPKGDIQAPGELAAAPYVMEVLGIPQVVLASRDIARGVRMSAARRLIDPPMNTPLPVLPNPITVVKPAGQPVTSTATPATATPAVAPTLREEPRREEPRREPARPTEPR